MGTSRSRREKQRADRMVIGLVVLVLTSAGLAVWILQPSRIDAPLVTVFRESDCECCKLWVRHLRAWGFQVQMGRQEEWAAMRARFKVPETAQACHTAVVGGLLIEGHVPARDVQWLLARRDREGLVGLILPGMPAGSPGMKSTTPEAYTVFGLDSAGNLRPVFKHDHRTE